MKLFIQSVAAFFAIFGFSLILEVPRRYLFFTGIAGSICWFFYLAVHEAGCSFVMAAFISCLVVAVISHIFARVLKAPVTVFLVPGILPTVPGASIYRCVYFMIQGLTELSYKYFVQTIQIAGGMALAIFIVDSFFRLGQKTGMGYRYNLGNGNSDRCDLRDDQKEEPQNG